MLCLMEEHLSQKSTFKSGEFTFSLTVPFIRMHGSRTSTKRRRRRLRLAGYTIHEVRMDSFNEDIARLKELL